MHNHKEFINNREDVIFFYVNDNRDAGVGLVMNVQEYRDKGERILSEKNIVFLLDESLEPFQPFNGDIETEMIRAIQQQLYKAYFKGKLNDVTTGLPQESKNRITSLIEECLCTPYDLWFRDVPDMIKAAYRQSYKEYCGSFSDYTEWIKLGRLGGLRPTKFISDMINDRIKRNEEKLKEGKDE